MATKLIRPLLAAVLVMVTLAACSSDSKVGDDSLLNVKDEVAKQRLGERTTTTAAPSTTAPGAKVGLGAATTTTKPKAVTTAPAAKEYVITINGDRSGAASQFDPNNATVYVNYPVRFQNNDTSPRSVVSNENKFRSPAIPPGGSWTLTLPTPGQYNYQDGTRPYAVGSIRVVPR
jgi:plastocyanin